MLPRRTSPIFLFFQKFQVHSSIPEIRPWDRSGNSSKLALRIISALVFRNFSANFSEKFLYKLLKESFQGFFFRSFLQKHPQFSYLFFRNFFADSSKYSSEEQSWELLRESSRYFSDISSEFCEKFLWRLLQKFFRGIILQIFQK